MRILVGADGSKHGTAALRSGLRLLTGKDRNVEVLCVAPRVHPMKAGLQKRLQRHAARIADRVVQLLAEDGVTAKARVHAGSPARILLSCSRDFDVALISAQSHQGPSVAGLGPVASRLLEHANTSVLLARGGEVGSPAKILMPVDGSEAGFRALEKLQEIIDVSSGEVTLLHVVETPWIRPVDEQEWVASEDDPDQESDLEREFTQGADALLEQARAMLPPRITVGTMIYQGIPAEEILTEANSGGYDLVVLAATGERDLKHRILGSVSSKVAWNAPCSVLLVHQE